MNKEFEKIIEKLEKELKLADEEKLRCARENPLQFDSAKGYAHGVGKAIEIIKQEAEQYEECYKDCGQCEAYDKEKHHCPKFCKVIKETVKEIEENHNDWISCSERLPEAGKRYLVSVNWKDNKDFEKSAVYDSAYGSDGLWHSYHYEPVSCKVVAWQPLPKPFKERD